MLSTAVNRRQALYKLNMAVVLFVDCWALLDFRFFARPLVRSVQEMQKLLDPCLWIFARVVSRLSHSDCLLDTPTALALLVLNNETPLKKLHYQVFYSGNTNGNACSLSRFYRLYAYAYSCVAQETSGSRKRHVSEKLVCP